MGTFQDTFLLSASSYDSRSPGLKFRQQYVNIFSVHSSFKIQITLFEMNLFSLEHIRVLSLRSQWREVYRSKTDIVCSAKQKTSLNKHIE